MTGFDYSDLTWMGKGVEPYALQLGMRGWFAVDRRDGTQCPTWQAKKHGKKVRTE